MNINKLSLLLLVIIGCQPIEAQIQKLSFEANVIPTYYKDKYPSLSNFSFYDYGQLTDFVLISNFGFNIFINKYFGIQTGIQYHALDYDNPDYIVRVIGSFDETNVKEYDFSIASKTKYLETPFHIIIRENISEKIDLSFLLGGSPLLRIKYKSRLSQKSTGKSDKYESDWTRLRIESDFSPQVICRLIYKLNDTFSLSTSFLVKSKEVSNLRQFYLGLGMGLVYELD